MAQPTDPFELFDELLHAHPHADVDLRRASTVTRVPDQLEDLFDLLPTLPPASGRFPAVPDRPALPVAEIEPAPVMRVPAARTTLAPALPTPPPDLVDRDREIRAIVSAAETQIATIRAQLHSQRRPRRTRGTIALLALTSLLLSAVTVVVLSRRDDVLPEVPNPSSAFDLPPGAASATSPAPAPGLEPAEGPPIETPPRPSPVSTSPTGVDSPDTTSAAPRPTATSGQSSAKPTNSLLSPSERYLTRDAELVMQVKPEVPQAARDRGETGLVEVDVTIDDLGRVAQATAVSGPETLRTAAEAAARRWRFRPALESGRPVESRRRVGVTFE